MSRDRNMIKFLLNPVSNPAPNKTETAAKYGSLQLHQTFKYNVN
jgi:hypothetical protein